MIQINDIMYKASKSNILMFNAYFHTISRQYRAQNDDSKLGFR